MRERIRERGPRRTFQAEGRAGPKVQSVGNKESHCGQSSARAEWGRGVRSGVLSSEVGQLLQTQRL